MKNWKKLILLLLAVVLVFAFAACGGAEQSDDDDSEKTEDTEPTLNPGDDSCEHVFTEWEIIKESTCAKDGKQERQCESCGKEEEQVLPAFGHVYDDGVCEECGKKAKDCKHNNTEEVVTKEATCTNSGEKREICTKCKAVVDYDYIGALWHPTTEVVTISEATCTENGKKNVICTVCDAVVDTQTIYALWHPDQEKVIISESTCTEKGKYQMVCTRCNEVVDTYTTSALGHDNEYIDAKAATCTQKGWSSYRKCTVCDYVYGYTEYPATGHKFQFGTCTNCGISDAGFTTITAPGLTLNDLTINRPEDVSYTAESAIIKTYKGNIASKNTVEKYTLTVTVPGTYRIWLEEVYSGYYMQVYVKNSLNENVDYDYYVNNNEGICLTLKAGTYTIEVRYGSGISTYNLMIGYAKPTVDITEYDVIKDKMEFKRQINVYTFTPAVTGTYRFHLSDMLNNAQMSMQVYNHLNECISYNNYVENGDGVNVTLTAGQTYTLYVNNSDSYITPYTMSVGKQKETVMIDGYNQINDYNKFYGQVNLYQFVATSSRIRIDVVNVASGMRVNLELYNHLNERVANYNYADNGEGFNYYYLVPGQTYTIKVYQDSSTGTYTLRALQTKDAVNVTTDSAVLDKIEYYGQTNYYQYTADASGEVVLTLRVDDYSNGRYVGVYVYNESGNQISWDDSLYSGDTLKVTGLTSGEIYTVCLVYNGNSMEYAISFT